MNRPRPSPFKCSAVISDVDGTLVTDDKILTARAQAAVAELRASGILFPIISSRPPRGLRMLLDPLGITTPVGGFNGGVIATPDLSVITEHLLSSRDRSARGRHARCARGAGLGFQRTGLAGARPRRALCRVGGAHGGVPADSRRGFRTLPSMLPPRSSVSARISSFSHGVSAMCAPRSPIRLPSRVRSLTTSTSPTRSPTRASHCRRSRSCWPFRWRRSPSSATAATMSRCSSGVVLASPWAMPARRCSGQRIS